MALAEDLLRRDERLVQDRLALAELSVGGERPAECALRGQCAWVGGAEALEPALVRGAVQRYGLVVASELRQEARTDKNWALSDRIRDRLAAAGFVIRDTKDGGFEVERQS